MQLSERQKLEAMAFRFYQGGSWKPKAGDLYTTTRADLEVYEVVEVGDGVVKTRYLGGGVVSAWPADEFQTKGFGPNRVWIPEWVLDPEWTSCNAG